MAENRRLGMLLVPQNTLLAISKPIRQSKVDSLIKVDLASGRLKPLLTPWLKPQ
jgi:hypothetical protein